MIRTISRVTLQEPKAEITITGTVKRSITVHRGAVLVLLGVVEDGVVVAGGGFAQMAGTTNGLFVAVSGQAVLTGTCRTCQGTATNDGGRLAIEGSCPRKSSNKPAAPTWPAQASLNAATRLASL
jgi:hypothetical protein